MSHLGYVIAAYAVFLGVLAIDGLGSWLRLRWARRDALRSQQRRQARSAAANTAAGPLELER